MKTFGDFMKTFGGKKTHIVATILGIAVSTYAVYWLGRSDEVDEIVDIVKEQGETTLKYHDNRTGKITPIYMSTD